MQRAIFFILGIFLFAGMLFACVKGKSNESIKTRLHVGDIAFDPTTDNPNFKVCGGRIYQYYNFGKGNFSIEKKQIRKHFTDKFKKTSGEIRSGYVTIRFVVNCEGETDRFRVFEINTDWQETHFKKELTDQLLLLTKSLKGWKPGEFKGAIGKFPFYQYLTFKIRDGDLVDILP